MARPMPKSLDGALDKAWMLPAERGRILLNRPSEEDTTGASVDMGEGLIIYLTGIVSHGTKDVKRISLIGIEESGRVMHSHSLFCMSVGD